MILRILTLLMVLSSTLASPLFARAERGSLLVGEAGGINGAAGLAGVAGTAGIAGTAGTSAVLDFAEFFLLDTDPLYAALVGPGLAAASAVPFPTNGSSSAVITRTGPSSFNLPAIGTYLVQFEALASNAGQLQLRLNGAYVADSVVGRATGQTQLVGVSLVTTSVVNSVLEVVNPPANGVLTFAAPGSSGAQTFTSRLSIMRIQ
jgi:hypothetical protein